MEAILTNRASILKQVTALALLLVLCLGAGAVGALETNQSIRDWYPTLAKPSWNPPDWVFGPVWTTLYVMMAVAAWLVWRSDAPGARVELSLFAVQLVLNIAWSFCFFTMRRPGLAFADIVLLWAAIAATTIAFLRISIPAALLMAPYLAWVTFAGALNATIWRLNA